MATNDGTCDPKVKNERSIHAQFSKNNNNYLRYSFLGLELTQVEIIWPQQVSECQDLLLIQLENFTQVQRACLLLERIKELSKGGWKLNLKLSESQGCCSIYKFCA